MFLTDPNPRPFLIQVSAPLLKTDPTHCFSPVASFQTQFVLLVYCLEIFQEVYCYARQEVEESSGCGSQASQHCYAHRVAFESVWRHHHLLLVRLLVA